MIKIINAEKATTTKEFMDAASKFGSKEYELLKRFRSECPNCKLIVTNRKKKQNKNYNATYSNMRKYIEKLPDSSKKLLEFEKIRDSACIQISPYNFVLAWFDATYPNARSAFEAEEVKETSKSEDAALSA